MTNQNSNESKGPLVSIGVPIFNEEKFLEQSLGALEQQTYGNIEILISDNGSTDNTETICRSHLARDQRIIYHRFDSNIGPVANFEYVFKKANGKYFMWAAGHDLWASNYISECVNLLEKNDSGVVAFGTSSWIDSAGKDLKKYSGWSDTRGLDVVARYFTVLWGNMHPILGVIKKEHLNPTPAMDYVGFDLVMLTFLALKGHFLHANNTLWSRREFRSESSYKEKLNRYKSKEYGLRRTTLDRYFPLAKLPCELIKVVLSANISSLLKLLILIILLPTLPVKYLCGKYLSH